MICCDFIGNAPPGGGGAGGGGGIPDVYFRALAAGSPATVFSGTEYTVPFTQEIYDNGDRYVPSTFNCPEAGLYLFQSSVKIQFQSAGNCRVYFNIAGFGDVGEDKRIIGAGAEEHTFNLSALIWCAQNRLVQVRLTQVTGNTASIGIQTTEFNGALLRIGPAAFPS